MNNLGSFRAKVSMKFNDVQKLTKLNYVTSLCLMKYWEGQMNSKTSNKTLNK